jgi:hypothetical protein
LSEILNKLVASLSDTLRRRTYLRNTLRTEENRDKTPGRWCQGLYPSQASPECKSNFYLQANLLGVSRS